jgi:glycosyltransferase involved in cell wall biosynthesis
MLQPKEFGKQDVKMTTRNFADLYDSYYFAHYRSDSGRPYERDEEWLRFFRHIAQRIVLDIKPRTVLDAGCAMGFLVECLRGIGVAAFGVDISEYAIEQVHPDIKPYCWTGSVTEPFPQKYDLIVCIEVVEHMPAVDAEVAIQNFCRHTDDILFSSSPEDYKEATHFNVRPPESWAEIFARYGFFRDVEYDSSFITPWAARFRRINDPIVRTLVAYERRLWRLAGENNALRSHLIEQRTELAEREKRETSLKEQVDRSEAQQQSLREEIRISEQNLSLSQANESGLVQRHAKLMAEFNHLRFMMQQRENEFGELSSILDRIYNSHGWKALDFYYRIRNGFFRPGSKRRQVARFIWNLAWHRKNAKINSDNHQKESSKITSIDKVTPVDTITTRRTRSPGSAAHILVISGDVLPFPGLPTTGAGLRAWGIGEGLRSRGHVVSYAMPKEAAEKSGYSGTEAHLIDSSRLELTIQEVKPDILVFQHWPWVSHLTNHVEPYVVIDFHGPLLLETLFREADYVGKIVDYKLLSLSRADYFICAGRKQLYYYLGWLLAAGVDVRDFGIATVPFSLSPHCPAHLSWPEEPVFVYGGVFLPWQNPALGLQILVEELERTGRGSLEFFGGKHPWMELPSHSWDSIRTQLNTSERVHFRPLMPRNELLKHYSEASVAWDLMERNPERELAFTSRTVEYLWCGLPVVYNNYSELSEYIAEYDAGWVIDPSNKTEIRQTVREIFECPALVRRKGENAQRLVRERLTWDVAIEPLDTYCKNPYRAKRIIDGPLLTKSNAAFIPSDNLI